MSGNAAAVDLSYGNPRVSRRTDARLLNHLRQFVLQSSSTTPPLTARSWAALRQWRFPTGNGRTRSGVRVADDDRGDGVEGGATRSLLVVIVATVVLYLGRDILLPLAMASILAVAFSPIASRLEPFVSRFVSAALVVLIAISAIGVIGYFLTVELTSVAVEVAGYSDNIATKLATLQGSTPTWLRRIEGGVKGVQEQLRNSASEPKERIRTMMQAQPAPAGVKDVLQPALPILSGIGESLLIVVLLFFLLHGRRTYAIVS